VLKLLNYKLHSFPAPSRRREGASAQQSTASTTPILPPALPPAGAEGGDVLGRTLRLVLEVVATEVRQLLVHWAQHMEPLE
jgi:hypothetical protein